MIGDIIVKIVDIIARRLFYYTGYFVLSSFTDADRLENYKITKSTKEANEKLLKIKAHLEEKERIQRPTIMLVGAISWFLILMIFLIVPHL